MAEKARVIQIGTIDPLTHQPLGWIFDCRTVVPVLEVKEDGTVLHGGYTYDELIEFQVQAVIHNSCYPELWNSTNSSSIPT